MCISRSSPIYVFMLCSESIYTAIFYFTIMSGTRNNGQTLFLYIVTNPGPVKYKMFDTYWRKVGVLVVIAGESFDLVRLHWFFFDTWVPWRDVSCEVEGLVYMYGQFYLTLTVHFCSIFNKQLNAHFIWNYFNSFRKFRYIDGTLSWYTVCFRCVLQL